ncbi:MAG: hypothetical protein V3T48_09315 [Vicinamibacterales bacterium]
MIHRCYLSVLLAAVLCGRVAAGDGASFTPGHAYVPGCCGLVIEWDENLNQVGSFVVEDLETGDGATFNADGNLVLVGRRQDGVWVMEVNADGVVLQEYHTGLFSLLLASFIDQNPVSLNYAVATDDSVTILDQSLGFVTATTSYEFTRASGVAWGPAGSLWATDSLGHRLLEFDADLNLVTKSFVGIFPTGMDLTTAGILFVTKDAGSDLLRIDLESGDQQTIVEGLGFGSMWDVVQRDDGNLLTVGGGTVRMFSADGQLLAISFPDPPFASGQSIAYLRPAPPFTPCPWDLDGDGNVFVTDLLLLLGDFGSCDGSPADFDDDGCVGVPDLLALIANFGPCPGSECVWDVNGDGFVGNDDLQQVLDNFGPCDGCPEDVNGDDVVDGSDAAAVATHFGPCP